MSIISGGDSDKSIILYFLLFTTIFYVGAYISLNHFGYSFSDVTPNGNLITPIIEDTFNAVSDTLNWFTSFSLSIFGYDITPFGWLSFLTTGLIALINQFIIFVNVWNILNIYIFYIIFIPYALIVVLILIEFLINKIEGLIP